MADNFAFTEGSGKTGSADDVGGILYARVKLDIGTDGVGTPVIGGAGAVAAGVPRVTLASDDPAVVLLGTIDTDTGVIAGDTTSIDGKITACNTGAVVLTTGSAAIGKLAANSGVDIGDVDVTSLIPGSGATNLGKAIDVSAGANDVGVAPLAIRDDTLGALTPAEGDWTPLRVNSTGALHVTGGGGGTQYAINDALGATPTGTLALVTRDDALGGLTPVEGDAVSLYVDANGALWTHDNALKAVLDGNYLNCNMNLAGTDAQAGEGTISASTQRVTLATDDDGVAHLATIAGDTTSIDGKITACNTGAVVISSGTVTTVSTVTSLSQLGGQAINLGEGTISTGTQRITLATDDDAVASLGVIDDWDAVHDSAVSTDGPQIMAAYDATKPAAVADGDAVRVLADEYGRLLSGVEKTAWHGTLDSADASAAGVVVKASAASTVLVIQSYVISVDAEMWVHLVDEDDTVLTGKFWLKAGGGVAITLPDKAPIIMGVNKDLEVRTEGAGNISVSATGYTIPG